MGARVGWIGLCLCYVLACAGPEPRVSRQLDDYAGVLVSNWPAREERPEPRREGNVITFAYPFLVENQSNVAVTLQFGNAVVLARGHLGRLTCSVGGTRVPHITLPPKDRARVDCHVWLGPDVVGAVANADTDVSLSISITPLDEPIHLSYLLRVEDAS